MSVVFCIFFESRQICGICRTLNDGISAVKALKNEYEELFAQVLQAQSKVENLERIIAEKEEKLAKLDSESQHLNEKLATLIHQNQALDSTLWHYREVKR